MGIAGAFQKKHGTFIPNTFSQQQRGTFTPGTSHNDNMDANILQSEDAVATVETLVKANKKMRYIDDRHVSQ